ncbi:MAG TPA: DEAD/DEAH box helicase [Kiritimatiellia bacterium]|nr:DEAD/DEAH box helicase [Kiritimatiellia bacterium]HMP00649.1 DEAD/DEAH box helicase [Kiritimatiellia bacterium]
MNATTLRKVLADPAAIKSHGFEILQSLCCFAGESRGQVAQELILRALEYRELFGDGAEVVDGLARQFGLFPYLDPERLSSADLIAYEVHRPEHMADEVVFHRPQAEVYWRLMAGENVVLSAPTSFGKSLIIDAAIASGRYKNVLIVVPTIALIDETRRRLADRFRGAFKVITHGTQTRAERNIFIVTQERALEKEFEDPIDLLVVDEFYKLRPTSAHDERSALLNQVVYSFLKRVPQFYMLGPTVLGISPDFGERIKYSTFLEPYHTVASELHTVAGTGDDLSRLVELCKSLPDPTLIFCKSPSRAGAVARHMIKAGLGKSSKETEEAANWVGEHYHPSWHFAEGLRQGIGVHHGRIPRALAQYVVRAFDDGHLRFLVCTSTLIEGVNTKAKNIVILDHAINRVPIDLFTFNNIRGRAGRMRQHFVGHVYLFHPEPDQELPLVEMPVYTQLDDTPESLLIQLDDDDLKPSSRERMEHFFTQDVLNHETLKASVGVDPQRQLNMAREIREDLKAFAPILIWDGLPTAKQVQGICKLMWRHFEGHRLGGGSVRSPEQLAYLINGLRSAPSTRSMVSDSIAYWNDPDEAIQQVLDFLRLWANFHFPRLLRCLDRIQKDVFTRAGMPHGDYTFFSDCVENFFLDAGIVALEEYGVPLEIGRKLASILAAESDLDRTLERFGQVDIGALKLSPFEIRILREAQAAL